MVIGEFVQINPLVFFHIHDHVYLHHAIYPLDLEQCKPGLRRRENPVREVPTMAPSTDLGEGLMRNRIHTCGHPPRFHPKVKKSF